MARIVVIVHETEPRDLDRYSMRLFIDIWTGRGHEVVVVAGTNHLPPADIAVLHVDLSVVPQAYAEAACRYPRVINGGALDIRKRSVSHCLVTQGDGWDGPVIVKTDLNSGGVPEWRLRQRELNKRDTKAPKLWNYKVYPRAKRVPNSVWSTPGLIVERFLPERDKKGYALRTWLFFGDHERCRRAIGPKPLVKGSNIADSGPAPVPDEIRAERVRLKIDYGKFDFVIHQGQPVLYDANKTPALPPPSPAVGQLYEYLAAGLEARLTSSSDD